MNCGVCNKVMRKDINIDGIMTCNVCRKIWVDGFNKMREYAIKYKEELKY
jgi:hypothetical protein